MDPDAVARARKSSTVADRVHHNDGRFGRKGDVNLAGGDIIATDQFGFPSLVRRADGGLQLLRCSPLPEAPGRYDVTYIWQLAPGPQYRVGQVAVFF